MDPITRQTTTQSNNSLLVVALDQNGPMISHTIETIHYHDKTTEEENNDNNNENTLSLSLKKSATLQSDKTMPPPTSPSSQIDQSSSQVNDQQYHSKSISPSSIHHHHHPNTSLTPWKFWKKNSSKVDPKLLSNTKKNFILFIVASAGCSSPLASTIYLPALVTMQEAFHTTDTTMNASNIFAIFTFFTAFFPLLWAALAERFGRRKIYLASFIITTIGSICCGLSINIAMLIVFRAFSAIGSSSTMSMGAGTLSDVFEIHERGRAFAWYIIGPLFGPCFGPIIGGLLNNAFGFRSIFYFLGIINFLILLNIFFFLPDTDSVSKRKKSNIINPFSAMDLFLYKNIALCVAFLGILFFSFYLVNANFSRSYASIYGFESSIVGVCYLPNAIGCAIGGIAGGRLSDKRYIRNAKKLTEKNTIEEDVEKENGMSSNNNNSQSQQEEKEKVSSSINKKQQPYPEMRLGGILFYGSIILQLVAITGFGWCIQVKTHFAYGLVCQFFYGMGLMVTNVILSTYMVDCFRHRGASVTACNNLTRYLLAGIGSLVSSDLERGMGPGPMYTFLGALLTLFGVNLILIQWKGNTWRYEKMKKQQEKKGQEKE
ncbi:major facilitator superfamily domain-containing protein [Cunninghamella echinulata]|nr:major facilitator superfamily domain-containing protein [Cunninghamella echinulata]